MLRIISLSLWSTACVIPVFWKTGLNIVTQSYLRGSLDFWNGINPYYSPQVADVFQYPPVFALFYGGFTVLSPFLHAVAWAFLNAFVFWWGMGQWFVCLPGKTVWKWAALAMAAMELDISLRYQQVNGCVTGLLLASAFYYRNSPAKSGFWLAVATAIKIFPVALAGLLGLGGNRRFWLSLVLGGLVLLFLPVIKFGFLGNWELLRSLVVFLGSDLYQRQMFELKSSLERIHWPILGLVLDESIMIITGLLFALQAVIIRKRSVSSDWQMEWWLPLFLTAFVLVNPRTESPGYVIMAPTYLFLVCQEELKGKIWVLLSFLLTTFVYTSAWPRHWLPAVTHLWASKPIGVLMLWGWVVFRLFRVQVFELRKVFCRVEYES